MNSTEIIVRPDLALLNSEAARRFAVEARAALSARGRFTVALSGGSTPKALYELLAAPPWSEQMDWARAQVFWGDERMVPPDDARSNYRMAREALLSRVSIPAENIHRVRTEAGDPALAARDYERAIRDVFATSPPAIPRFDLILLGLGENGHTASLFPSSKTLHEQSRLVVEDYVDAVAGSRITMTAPLLNAGRTIVFLVSGATKAQVVRDVIAGPRDTDRLPAQLIQPNEGRVVWLLDEAAAGLLPANIKRSA